MKRFLYIVIILLIVSVTQATAGETEVTRGESNQEKKDFAEYTILEACEPFNVQKIMDTWQSFEPQVMQEKPVTVYSEWDGEKTSPHKSGWYKNPETDQVVLVLLTNGNVTVYGFRRENCYFN